MMAAISLWELLRGPEALVVISGPVSVALQRGYLLLTQQQQVDMVLCPAALKCTALLSLALTPSLDKQTNKQFIMWSAIPM